MAAGLTELLSLPVEAHRVTLEAATPRILRLTIAASREAEEAPSYAIEARRWTPVEAVTRRARSGATVISTGELEITAGTGPFSMRVTDSGGELLFETAPASRGGKYTDTSAGNSPFEWIDEGVCFSRRLLEGEIAYGFGEVGETLDRNGYRFGLWNTDDIHHTPRQHFYCQIPFGIHFVPPPIEPVSARPSKKSKGRPARVLVHGAFIDNPGRVEVDLGCTTPGVARYRAHHGDLVVWLIFADSIPHLLEQWTGLTGRMGRPPMWGLGYHQCRYSYYPERQVRKLAAEFRRRRIPCDAIYLDIHYMDRFRVFTWDKKRFPDPARLAADLSGDGFRLVTIVDPGVKVDTADEVFQSFIKKPGFFCEHAPGEDGEEEEQEQYRRVQMGEMPLLTEELIATHEVPPMRGPQTVDRIFTGMVWPGAVHFPDFTRADVRRLWGEWQKRQLLDMGIAGIWNDMNEPAVFDTVHHTFPDDVIHDDHGRQSPHPRVHQVYGQCMARASFEGIRRARPDERPFVITRSGWAGVQRYAMLWTGDNHSTWASMTLDVQLNLSMGLTGIAMVGCDIGGFINDGQPELYGRWIEWGVFQPFCRTHTAIDTIAQEPWSFGPDVETVIRRMIGLRMRLLPYLYTAMCEAATNGTPANRPLVWHYPEDPSVYRIADQFLLGRDLLVAPVLTPSTTSRLVYLPAGEWTHFFTGERFAGGRQHIIEAPLGRPPLFVRDGAVIPLHDEVRQHTGDTDPKTTVLEVYPGAEMAGQLVEDDGVSRKYLKGEQARYAFSGSFDGEELRLTIPKPSGRYLSGRKQWLIRVHVLNGFPQRAQVNGRTVEVRAGGDGTAEVTIPDGRQKAELRLSLLL